MKLIVARRMRWLKLVHTKHSSMVLAMHTGHCVGQSQCTFEKNMSSKQILHTTQRIRCNGSLFSFVCTILLSMWKNKHTAHTNCTLTLTLNFSIVFHRRIATCDYCERTSCAVASYTIFSCYLDHFCNPLLLPSDFFLLVAVFIA